MKDKCINLLWFRQDLRLVDNPALKAAVESGSLLPIYILDDVNAGACKMGAASRVWLQHSLTALNQSLDGKLQFFRGDARKVIAQLVDSLPVDTVFWNRCYEPWRIARDRRIMTELRAGGCAVTSLNGSLLFEPQSITKADGTPYKVFTPFYQKGCVSGDHAPRAPLSSPTALQFAEIDVGCARTELELLPDIRWYDEMAQHWMPGEQGAQQRLRTFLVQGIRDYEVGRNRPDQNFVSRLSPHLHFGEISPHQLWQEPNL